MTDLLRELKEWLTPLVGPWASRIVALFLLLVVYVLVWWCFTTMRRVVNLLLSPPSDESRVGIVLVGIIQCVIAIAALVWVASAAIDVLPDWLGL